MESPTVTQRDQLMVEMKVAEIYHLFASLPHHAQTLMLELQRGNHVEYLTKGLKQLGPNYGVLDAKYVRHWMFYWVLVLDVDDALKKGILFGFFVGVCGIAVSNDVLRPWLCYWILHSIALLGDFIDCNLENDAVDFLNRCQLPHLATTYAAVNSLITLGGEEALSSINREKMHGFLLRMKDPSGGFRMSLADLSEMDVRACYTAISVASVLDILDYDLVQNVGNYILSCQTYEGGIAGEPGSEAHGGYTFCGLATMILINEVERLDLPSLLVAFSGCWTVACQRKENCGKHRYIQTPNSSDAEKVPGASSTDGGGMSITDSVLKLSDIGFSFIKEQIELDPLFQSIALQQYILFCSQVQDGRFRDKPGKQRDHYHTCYCLSGLSVSQHCWSKDVDCSPLPKAIFGPYSNLLERTHPLFNIVLDRYHEAHDFFSGQ
ncbi:hypothetical protein Scep_021330 [Stephania cephalantha]|uniref:Prenyltransferase alpha-alpha toroid domain-containing protein n=1 Tax=Stephania cephalantha TaxID=152367 RepID=A0AAP0F4E6_9MAGN